MISGIRRQRAKTVGFHPPRADQPQFPGFQRSLPVDNCGFTSVDGSVAGAASLLPSSNQAQELNPVVGILILQVTLGCLSDS